jgi:hypothetical protein
MDLKLQSDEFFDNPCGTPTNPEGEQRYCCRQCPEMGKPLRLKAVYASNPQLMAYLSKTEQDAIYAMAVKAGPDNVDIVVAAPAPVENAAPVNADV